MRSNEEGLADGAACLDAALLYLERGWCPIPLCPPDHVGVGKAHAVACRESKDWGKVPMVTWKALQTSLPSERDIREWWRYWPNANVGVLMGPVSGLIGLDLDGEAGLAAFYAKNGVELPHTLIFKTPGGGLRVLYELAPGVLFPNGFENWSAHQEFRVLAQGTQTVMPPSRHRLGGYYAWSE